MYTISSPSPAEAGYERFARLAEPSPRAWLNTLRLNGGRALHVGCGSGVTTIALTRWFHQVVGADYSVPLIQMAQSSNPHPCVEYRHVNFLQYSEDEGFDFIFAHMTVHDLEDIHAGLANIRRMVKPGGTVLVVDRTVEYRWLSYLESYSEAVVRLPSDVARLGRHDALWLFRYRTSRSRVRHLAADCHLSSAEFVRTYSAAFPKCYFHKKSADYAMIWRKPGVGWQ